MPKPKTASKRAAEGAAGGRPGRWRLSSHATLTAVQQERPIAAALRALAA